MSADNGQNEVLAAFMDEMKSSMADVEGVDDFTETARSVVVGEMAVDEAVPRMMAFFTGETAGNPVERARLVQLAQEIKSRAGLVPIVLLSFSTCRDVLKS
ncbi:hypothetical protein [Saccharothrix luteola]|uniref:hypothetical protein n=1 Tax=Saccharothrix luteola TaxID=2893018 RepID=UPI001E306488|nr:hypothetical protein [Saccharothrix luteola]MCC8250520.1 hypothetical protein [Saccharothrix luteola]